MKKMHTAVFTVLFFLFTLVYTNDSIAQLSLAAGLNFGKLSDISFSDQKASFDTATGYHVGLTYEFSLILVTVRPGVFYRKFGDITIKGVDSNSDLDLTFIDVPIDILFRLGIIPIVKPFLLVGPVFSFPNASDSLLDDAFESFSTSLALGAGITIRLLGISLTPELRYEFGISRLVKDNFDFGGEPDLELDSDPPESFAVRLGVGF